MTDRISTACDLCGQVDTHPKHHVYDPEVGRLESHHHDCAPDCTVCAASERLTGGKRGDELSAHVSTGKHAKALADALGSEIGG